MPPEPHRSASVDRHFLLAEDLLRGREHDKHSLAARLGIKPAQAHRLMKVALKLPGVAEHQDGRRRAIKMDLTAIAPAPSYPTAVAACFGSSLWPLFEGSTYREGIRDASRDVTGRTKRRTVFRDIDRKFWFLRRGGEVALLDRSPLLDEVIEAVLRHRVLSLEYTRFNGNLEHLRIEPLSIVVHDHQLYVVGRDGHDDRGRLHPYRFSRIRSVGVLPDTFEYPGRTEYDPEQVFRDSFRIFLDMPVQDVQLRLHRQWITYAQSHRWHDSQKVEVAADHVIVRMHVRVCPELEAWILGFGEEAEVLSPAALRTKIGGRAAALGRIYAHAPVSSPRPSVRKAGRAAAKTPAKGVRKAAAPSLPGGKARRTAQS